MIHPSWGSTPAKEIGLLAIKDHLSIDIEQPCAEVHQCRIAAGLVIDGHDLEAARHDISHEDRFQEAAALLDQGQHGIVKVVRHLGGSERRHGHQKQAMRNALSEASLGGKGFIVVEWVIVPGETSEQSELLLTDGA